MMNETTATKTPDARLVMFSKQLHVSSAAGVFNVVEKVGSMYSNSVPSVCAKSYYPNPAEVKDGSPVARAEDWFKVAAFIHLSPDAYERVMAALDREVSHE